MAAAVKAFAQSAEAPRGRRPVERTWHRTLYRHFPTRAALIEAAYRTRWSDCARPWRGVEDPRSERALRRGGAFHPVRAAKRGMIDALPLRAVG